MARIQGIQIEIGGNTQGLTQALRQVDNDAKTTQSELRQVERALKFDPGNTTLIAQQQQLLADSIQNASTRLDALRNAQERVQQQFDSGDIGIEQYRLFQRELANSESSLRGLQGRLDATSSTQERFNDAQQQLQTYLQATDQSLDDLASTLGSRLTNSIRDGSASADQLEAAIRRISQTSGNTVQDLERFQNVLRNSGNNNLDEVRRDLDRIGDSAEQAERDVSGLSGAIAGVAAGLGAAGIIQEALDLSSLNTQIDITLDVDDESREAVRQITRDLQSLGLEGEEALEAVRRQFVLNREASDESNQATLRYAGTIAAAYRDIDITELIQETNEISRSFGITNDEAIGLTNSLLRIGFPPDQLDIISEYGSQLIRAGFSAEQVQAVFAAGVDTGTYNIDILLDGLQEGRLRLTEFANGVDDATKELLSSASLSADELQRYGAAVARGGEEGERAYTAVAQAVGGIDDALVRNTVGVALFGTLYEQNGDLITDTLIGAQDQVVSLAENQRILNENTAALNASPAVQLSNAFNNLREAFAPVLDAIAILIAQIAQFASENIGLVAVIVGLVTTVGLLVGAFAVLAPGIGSLAVAFPALGATIAGLAFPITAIIATIVAFGAAFIALYRQSEDFRNGVNKVFESIKSVAESVFKAIADFIGAQIKVIQDYWATNGQQILQAAQNVFNGIKAVVDFVMPAIRLVVEVVWKAIQDVISGALNIILGAVKVFSGVFTGDFTAVWEGVKQIFKGAIDLILGLMTLSFFGGIRTAVVGFVKTFSTSISGLWTSVTAFFRGGAESTTGIIGNLNNVVNSLIKQLASGFISTISGLVTNAVARFVSLRDQIISTVRGINLFQIGADIVSGLIRGITSMAGNAASAIGSLANSVIDRAKSILKINSPSLVFEEIGEFTGEGLQVGIDRTVNDVANSSSRLSNAVINAQGSLLNSVGQSSRNGIAQQQIINNNSNFDMSNVIAAIQQLANTPLQPQLIVDGRNLTQIVSQYQRQDATIQGLSRGVQFT